MDAWFHERKTSEHEEKLQGQCHKPTDVDEVIVDIHGHDCKLGVLALKVENFDAADPAHLQRNNRENLQKQSDRVKQCIKPYGLSAFEGHIGTVEYFVS